jgi:hypothetical protein
MNAKDLRDRAADHLRHAENSPQRAKLHHQTAKSLLVLADDAERRASGGQRKSIVQRLRELRR